MVVGNKVICLRMPWNLFNSALKTIKQMILNVQFRQYAIFMPAFFF